MNNADLPVGRSALFELIFFILSLKKAGRSDGGRLILNLKRSSFPVNIYLVSVY